MLVLQTPCKPFRSQMPRLPRKATASSVSWCRESSSQWLINNALYYVGEEPNTENGSYSLSHIPHISTCKE